MAVRQEVSKPSTNSTILGDKKSAGVTMGDEKVAKKGGGGIGEQERTRRS